MMYDLAVFEENPLELEVDEIGDSIWIEYRQVVDEPDQYCVVRTYVARPRNFEPVTAYCSTLAEAEEEFRRQVELVRGYSGWVQIA